MRSPGFINSVMVSCHICWDGPHNLCFLPYASLSPQQLVDCFSGDLCFSLYLLWCKAHKRASAGPQL